LDSSTDQVIEPKQEGQTNEALGSVSSIQPNPAPALDGTNSVPGVDEKGSQQINNIGLMEGQAELSGKSPEVSLSPPPPESSKKASVGAAQFWVTPSFGVAAPLEPVSEEGEGDAPVAMPAAPPIDEELPATEEEANQKVEAQAPSDDVDNQAQAAQEDEPKPGDAPMQQPEVPSDPPVEEAPATTPSFASWFAPAPDVIKDKKDERSDKKPAIQKTGKSSSKDNKDLKDAKDAKDSKNSNVLKAPPASKPAPAKRLYAKPGNIEDHVKAWADCNPHRVTQSESETDFLVQKLNAASLVDSPVQALYACSFWPEGLYTRMLQLWPMPEIFDLLAPKERPREKKCNTRVCHRSFKMETLQNNNETLKEMQGVGKAQALWKRVEKMIFAKEFEETLFAKLGVKRVPHMKRTFQFLSDTAGYTKDSLVLSSNSAKKVVSLHVHLPSSPRAEMDYGMCLHTGDQYNNRKAPETIHTKGQEEADCELKFRFLPNSIVAVKTSAKTHHSTPNSFVRHHSTIDRNVLLINWYHP